MLVWRSKDSIFGGSKVTLIPAPDPTEGEVKSEMLDGPFMKLVPVNNLSTQFEHQKSF